MPLKQLACEGGPLGFRWLSTPYDESLDNGAKLK